MSAARPASVAVVVVTRDRVRELHRSLGHLVAAQGVGQVIVIDNASTDATPSMVRREFPDVVLETVSRNLGAAGRNLGVALADHELVAFADDDSWWAPGACAEAASIFRDEPEVGLLAGQVLLGRDGQDDPLNHRLAASPLGRSSSSGPDILGFAACGAMVRRGAFLEVGGFEPLLGIGGEETLLALRLRDAGWRCVYTPQLKAHHWPSARRDHAARRRVLERNRVWTEWLARPRRDLPASTARALGDGLGEASGRRGILEAIRGWRAVVVRRHAVGCCTGALWRKLDRHERSAGAP